MTVREKLTAVIADVLGVEPEKVVPEANFTEDLGADSLDGVDMIMEIEEAFDVEIPDEDSKQLTTVQAVLDYLASKDIRSDAQFGK